jgi:GT2 family glycosyltransferase
MAPKIAIAIVNYRTADLVINCLRSLEPDLRPALREWAVVIADNQSDDGSVEKLRSAIDSEGWNDWVSMVPLNHNGGYAFGNNAIIRPLLESSSPPDYVLLLNPDTIVRPGSIQELLDFMQLHPKVGMVGSRLEDPDGTPQRSAFRFHTILSELDDGLRLGLFSKLVSNWSVAPPVADSAKPTDWVAGASMMIRRQVFDSIGLLDEGYFLYFEEVDFCLRALRAGWQCWYEPKSRVVHLVGQATGVSDPKRASRRRPRYWFESRRRYFLKNHGRLYAAAVDVLWTIGHLVWRLRRILQRKTDAVPEKFLADFIRNSVFVRGFQI